jgi:ABC transporter substrate binding protein (PQQ-dependent alcohol dehydrogenase system)
MGSELGAAPQKPERSSIPATVTTSGTLNLIYLTQRASEPETQPYFDPNIQDAGLQGARLGIQDNNTTGQFLKQHFALKEVVVNPGEDPVVVLKQLIQNGQRHFIVDLPSDTLKAASGLAESQSVLFYNIGSPDDALREEACSLNMLHILPSRAMIADALGQYLAKKRWNVWLLLSGPDPEDQALAAAFRKSAKKFGHKIVQESKWQYQFEDRRTPESEIPVLTQKGDYDVVVVADEHHLFSDLLGYRTWLPRPVVGSSGLRPAAWDRTHEAWGALQLQTRFKNQTGREMTQKDYVGWLAVRVVGEAASRTHSLAFDAIRTHLQDPSFALAGFKGVPLSFRSWDQQLRQPVLLAADRSLIATAPVEGYLHPKNELDTLGTDQAESHCHLSQREAP